MPRKDASREIDGTEYHLKQMTATKALDTLQRILSAVGPSVVDAFTGLVESAQEAGAAGKLDLMDADIDLSKVGGAVRGFFDRMTIAERKAIQDALIGDCHIALNGSLVALKGPVFEEHFVGSLSTFFKLLGFALEINYSDFLGVLRGLRGMLGGVLASNLPRTQSDAGQETASS